MNELGSQEGGSEARMEIAAPRDVVFDHLIDPRTYPDWLVGAQRILSVDEEWPAPGSSFHHRIGFGPLTIRDRTTVVSVTAPDELVLEAFIGPLGSALVRFALEGSDPTTVVFDEAPRRGLVRRVGATAGRHALRATVWGRNRASLQQLDHLLGGTTPS